jgi:hypothetical protein
LTLSSIIPEGYLLHDRQAWIHVVQDDLMLSPIMPIGIYGETDEARDIAMNMKVQVYWGWWRVRYAFA